MAAFTVHEPPGAGGGRMERAESLLFVRDGFSWRAALFSPFYLFVRGEWLALAAYAVAALALVAVLRLSGAESDWYAWMFAVLNVVTGFEVSELKRWSLGRRGWREVATVSGRGLEEAERRFFEVWLPSLPDDGAAGPPTARRIVLPGDGATARLEAGVERLAARLRNKFALKT